MIRKLRVTVDGRHYEVSVELDDEPGAAAAPPVGGGPPSSGTPSDASGVSVAAIPTPVPTGAAAVTAGPGDVPSPLAGRVTAVNVVAGQGVKEGDHLLTLEAMKMNTFVIAPRAGMVKELKVSVGSAVEEGQALLLLA